MNLGKFGKFLTHHTSDLGAVAQIVGAILDVVPVNAQDRARIEAKIGKLTTSAENIAESLTRATTKGETDAADAPRTTGKAPTDAQMRKAVEAALPAALAAYFEANPPQVPAPVIAPATPGPDARTAGEAARGGDGTGTDGHEQHDDGTGRDVIEA